MDSNDRKWKPCDMEFAKQHPEISRFRIRIDEGHQWSWTWWQKASKCEFVKDGWYEFETLEV